MTAPSPLIAEIRSFAFGFAPEDWYECDGRLLPIAEHQALFYVLGWRFGGDGRTTFALPDLSAETTVDMIPAIAAAGLITSGARNE